MGLTVEWGGGPGAKDIEKAEERDATFSLLGVKTSFQESQVPEISEKAWNKEYLSSMEEARVWWISL